MYLRNSSSPGDIDAVAPPAPLPGFTLFQAQDHLSGDFACNASLDQGFCHILGDAQVTLAAATGCLS